MWRSTRKQLAWRSMFWRRSMKKIQITNCELWRILQWSFRTVLSNQFTVFGIGSWLSKMSLTFVFFPPSFYLEVCVCRCLTGLTTTVTCVFPSSCLHSAPSTSWRKTTTCPTQSVKSDTWPSKSVSLWSVSPCMFHFNTHPEIFLQRQFSTCGYRSNWPNQ